MHDVASAAAAGEHLRGAVNATVESFSLASTKHATGLQSYHKAARRIAAATFESGFEVFSKRMTRAPCRAAVIALKNPAAPPPITTSFGMTKKGEGKGLKKGALSENRTRGQRVGGVNVATTPTVLRDNNVTEFSL